MQKVAILFGGESSEHEVSIMSAKNVFEAVDRNLFSVELIYQDRSGIFKSVESFDNLDGKILGLGDWQKFDVVFPVMHGQNCEDGKLQGFFEILKVPYVGCGVLSSALGMDKDLQKQLARANRVKVTDWISVKKYEWEASSNLFIDKIKQMNFPVFVKPSNAGSSVGVVKVKDESELASAISSAFEYDKKILVEKAVSGREIELAVLGYGQDMTISNPGEVVSQGAHEFYDYEAKYLDKEGSVTSVPAPNISSEKVAEFKELARKIFTLLECRGLSRVDFFLEEDEKIVFNEINTLPGFTNISMYPKLMQESGINYTELITRLIKLAEVD
jgi:D-alanine-D-alanine ligase